MLLPSSRPRLLAVLGSGLLTLGAVAACGGSNKDAAANPDSSAAMAGASTNASAATTDTTTSNMSTSGMTMTEMNAQLASTSEPDKTFLEMMSNHHKGLIALTHLSVEQKKGSASVRADAEKLDRAQDAELDTMLTMLQTKHQTPYQPKVIPQNQAMVDSLSSMTGAAFDKQFYEDVVTHHQQAIAMIDTYLPRAKDEKLKTMAERMKKDQQQQIQEFQHKAQQTT